MAREVSPDEFVAPTNLPDEIEGVPESDEAPRFVSSLAGLAEDLAELPDDKLRDIYSRAPIPGNAARQHPLIEAVTPADFTKTCINLSRAHLESGKRVESGRIQGNRRGVGTTQRRIRNRESVSSRDPLTEAIGHAERIAECNEGMIELQEELRQATSDLAECLLKATR